MQQETLYPQERPAMSQEIETQTETEATVSSPENCKTDKAADEGIKKSKRLLGGRMVHHYIPPDPVTPENQLPPAAPEKPPQSFASEKQLPVVAPEKTLSTDDTREERYKSSPRKRRSPSFYYPHHKPAEPPVTGLCAVTPEKQLPAVTSEVPLSTCDAGMDSYKQIQRRKLIHPDIPPKQDVAPEKQRPIAESIKRKPGRPKKTQNIGAVNTPLSTKIDKNLHMRLKVMSVVTDQSIKSILEEWIQEHTPELS